MAALTLRAGLGRNLTPSEVDGNFTALNTESAAQQTAINLRAPIDNATFTGNVNAPTPSVNDNGTKVATTAFVIGQASDADPLANGTADSGVSLQFARADHVHPGSGGGGSAAQDSLTPGSSTVPPTVDAVVDALAAKANSADVTTLYDNLSTTLGGQIASKQGALSVTGLATLTGNVLNVASPAVSGKLTDGKSFMLLPGATAFSGFGPQVGALSTAGTYVGAGPANPTNSWNSRGRAGYETAATANTQARVMIQPRVRFPHSVTGDLTQGGFKSIVTFAVADALTGCPTFIGFLQNTPAAGAEPSAYTGTKWGFYLDSTDTDNRLKLYFGTTLIKDLGASFPLVGNETNPYEIEFEAVPQIGAAARYMRWKVTHLLTGATDSGTVVSASMPQGDFSPYFAMVRDTKANVAIARFYTTGWAGGGFYNLVIGDASGNLPVPGRITASTTLSRAVHANLEQVIKSATPVTLTVANTGYIDGDTLYGVNRGAGDVTIVGEGGFTIEKHPDLPAAVEQSQGFSLRFDGVDGVWTRVA
jgi:hypothetical protein